MRILSGAMVALVVLVLGFPWAGLRLQLLSRGEMGAGARSRQRIDPETVRELLEAVADEVAAGAPPRAALVSAAHAHLSFVPRARAAARMGADIPEALQRDAAASGHPLLASAAACWLVGETSGAGLAASLRALAASSRDADRMAGELAAQLAGPRTTAKVLLALPLLGLLLGQLLGGSPIRWLLGSSLGWACLAGGVILCACGFSWADRIARSAERTL